MTEPYYADETARLLHGDCVKVMRAMPAESVDTVVTDPPYALSFMNRGWDMYPSPARFEEWCAEWAAEALRVTRPGGRIAAFGGTRSFHRLACGIEDAGWQPWDAISTNV